MYVPQYNKTLSKKQCSVKADGKQVQGPAMGGEWG